MYEVVDPLLVVVLLLNFSLLGTGRVRAVINVSAFQGIVIGALPIPMHGGLHFEPIAIAVAAIAIKGVLIPKLLLKAMREVRIKREVEPLIGFLPSLLFGALGTGLALVFARTLPLAGEHTSSLIVP